MKKLFKHIIAKISVSTISSQKIQKIEKKIGYSFENKSVLETAITHTSYTANQSGELTFERMEFLGDAVLGLIISEELFLKYPNYSEGQLSELKSKLVSRKFLKIKAIELNLLPDLKINSKTKQMKGEKINSILGNAVESIICAIFIDGGLNKTRNFIRNHIINSFELYIETDDLTNYKSILQEFTQSQNSTVPIYKIVSEIGPEHEKTFTAKVYINDEFFGMGEGKNKKEAHQIAAKKACEKLGV